MKRRIVVITVTTVVVCAAVTGGFIQAFAGRDGGGGTGSETTPVRRGAVTTTVSAAGAVEALESRGLAFSTSGTVTELNVRAGDVVPAGKVLAKIDATSAREAVETAQSNVDSAREAVDRAESSTSESTSTSTSGSNCTAALALASTSPSTSASPSSTSSASPTSSSTSSRGGSSSSTAKGCVTSSSRSGQSGTSSSTRDNLLSAQQQLNNAKLTLRQAQDRLTGTVISAPVAGKVLSVAGVLGATAGSGTFIVLAGDGDAAVRAQFTEAEVAALSVGQKTRIVLADREDQEFVGKVIRVDLAGTTSNKLVRYAAIISFDAVPSGLLYGQSANVAVITSSVEDVLYVPSTAVVDISGTSAAVVVRANGRDERRAVDIGLRGDATTEIRTGVREGEEVLTAGR